MDEPVLGYLPPSTPGAPLVSDAELDDVPCMIPTRLESAFPKSTSLTRAYADARSIKQLLGRMARRSGLSTNDLASDMGIAPSGLRKYLCGAHLPGWSWFLRYAQACGAEVIVSFPDDTR